MSDPPFDPERILAVLVRHGVRFVVIGGAAARIWGSPAITRDVDVCYARDRPNLEALASALTELGAKLRGVKDELPFRLDPHTLLNGDSFTFTTRLGDLDVLATPSGTRGFDELAANAAEISLGSLRVSVASLDDLIRMKRAAGRPKDRAVMEDLGALREELQRRRRPRKR